MVEALTESVKNLWPIYMAVHQPHPQGKAGFITAFRFLQMQFWVKCRKKGKFRRRNLASLHVVIMSHECDGGRCCTEWHWRHGRDYTAVWAASTFANLRQHMRSCMFPPLPVWHTHDVNSQWHWFGVCISLKLFLLYGQIQENTNI